MRTFISASTEKETEVIYLHVMGGRLSAHVVWEYGVSLSHVPTLVVTTESIDHP